MRVFTTYLGFVTLLGMLTHPWRAIYCAPRSEISIAASCDTLGLENYCPRYKLIITNRGRKREVLIPFLYSYVFVRFDAVDPISWHDVMGIKGATRLLPGLVFDDEIDTLRSMVGDSGDLSYEIKKFFRKVNPGDRIRLLSGSFAGQEGVISEVDDDLSLGAVEIALLGRSLVVWQPLAWCELSSAERTFQHKRRRREHRSSRKLTKLAETALS